MTVPSEELESNGGTYSVKENKIRASASSTCITTLKIKKICFSPQPFTFQERPKSTFSQHYQYIIERKCCKN